ncbi:DUF1127 domain-containing protein [Rubellimicrobium arenae]|uniref:DUF1127 domain-containing protein n=1 Tax=Rubellimicrobium arenae TaxID=2817372 RepID=UPI001B303673|nr:DUF1127 domain-containing protein [Rubellimicrobium arenae]
MERLSSLAGHFSRRSTLSLSHLLRLAALARSRRQLADLEDHLLRDVGLTRTEARHEAEKPVWDAPGHWLR